MRVAMSDQSAASVSHRTFPIKRGTCKLVRSLAVSWFEALSGARICESVVKELKCLSEASVSTLS